MFLAHQNNISGFHPHPQLLASTQHYPQKRQGYGICYTRTHSTHEHRRIVFFSDRQYFLVMFLDHSGPYHLPTNQNPLLDYQNNPWHSWDRRDNPHIWHWALRRCPGHQTDRIQNSSHLFYLPPHQYIPYREIGPDTSNQACFRVYFLYCSLQNNH